MRAPFRECGRWERDHARDESGQEIAQTSRTGNKALETVEGYRYPKTQLRESEWEVWS